VMDETLNFDAVARRIVELTDPNLIREQLVLVWNGRGAADIAKLEVELSSLACVDRRHQGIRRQRPTAH
jgi:hypothetical protein